MNKTNSVIINTTALIYSLVGSIGGAVLGFFSFGIAGMISGLVSGSILAFFMLKGLAYLKINNFNES